MRNQKVSKNRAAARFLECNGKERKAMKKNEHFQNDYKLTTKKHAFACFLFCLTAG